jgi:Tfp pilus assembly protein FimT
VKREYKLLGFSLFEILLVLSIGSVLIFFALSWGNGIMDKNRAYHYANIVGDAIAFARANSIVHGQKIFFCHDTEGTVCGVIKNNCPAVVTESGQILRFLPQLSRGDKLCFGISSSEKDKHLVFMPHGLVDGRNGSFYYCPRGRSDHALSIIFNKAGRARIDTVDSQGNKINCDTLCRYQ